jgi:hypothetical protein
LWNTLCHSKASSPDILDVCGLNLEPVKKYRSGFKRCKQPG